MKEANLGPGPARLAADHGGTVVRDAGYVLTDFHALFRPGARFQGTDDDFALGPVELERVGAITFERNPWGGYPPQLAVFDPAAPGDTRTIFRRPVPEGTHPVFLARQSEELPLAAQVRFAPRPVHAWTPALTFEDYCPTPPEFELAGTQISFGIAQASLSEEAEAHVGRRVRTGDVWGASSFVAFGVGGAGAWPSWFGVDADGELVAWVVAWAVPRFHGSVERRVAIRDARGEPVDLGGVRARARGDEVDLWGPVETVWLEMPDGTRARRVSGHRTSDRRLVAQFTSLPDDATLVARCAAVTFPALPLDEEAVAKQLEVWLAEGHIEVEAGAIEDLAAAFVAEAPRLDARKWLAPRPEVTAVHL